MHQALLPDRQAKNDLYDTNFHKPRCVAQVFHIHSNGMEAAKRVCGRLWGRSILSGQSGSVRVLAFYDSMVRGA